MAKTRSIVILAIGHALIEHEDANREKPSKDSVWGIAEIDDICYTFSGRRTGKMRWKKAIKEDSLIRFQRKLNGEDTQPFRYLNVPPDCLEEFIEVDGFIETALNVFIADEKIGKIQDAPINNKSNSRLLKGVPYVVTSTSKVVTVEIE